LKQVIRRCQNEDVVDETLASLQARTPAINIRIDTGIQTLRNRSVRWLVTVHKELNQPNIVKQASATKLCSESSSVNYFAGILPLQSWGQLQSLF
jgi:hypothetical protein